MVIFSHLFTNNGLFRSDSFFFQNEFQMTATDVSFENLFMTLIYIYIR